MWNCFKNSILWYIQSFVIYNIIRFRCINFSYFNQNFTEENRLSFSFKYYFLILFVQYYQSAAKIYNFKLLRIVFEFYHKFYRDIFSTIYHNTNSKLCYKERNLSSIVDNKQARFERKIRQLIGHRRRCID